MSKTDNNTESFDFSNIKLPDFSKVDIKKLAPPSDPDFIVSNPRGREFMGQVAFNTGNFWLGGFATGGLYGMIEGYRGAVNPNFKIRMNSILNSVAMRGGKLGNSLGVIAFMHTCMVKLADEMIAASPVKIPGSKNEIATPALAGFMTGLLYKSGTGPRGALLAATIGSVGSLAYWYGGRYAYNAVQKPGGRY